MTLPWLTIQYTTLEALLLPVDADSGRGENPDAGLEFDVEEADWFEDGKDSSSSDGDSSSDHEDLQGRSG